MKSKHKEVIKLVINMISIAGVSAVFGYGYFWLLRLVTSYTALQCIILSIFFGCLLSSGVTITLNLNNGKTNETTKN